MGAIRLAPRPASILTALGSWLLGLSSAAAVPVDDALASTIGTAGRSLPPIGVMVDAGLPDGITGALVVRPIEYMRLHVGGGSNSASPGVRGGLSILPVGVGPSFNIEVGHYTEGDTNTLVRGLFAGLGEFGSYVRRVSYTYGNAHAGLDLGQRNFTFFIHGGLTYLRATLHDVEPPVDGAANPGRPGRTTVTFNKDPILKMLAPSAKMGLIVYFP